MATCRVEVDAPKGETFIKTVLNVKIFEIDETGHLIFFNELEKIVAVFAAGCWRNFTLDDPIDMSH